MHRKVLILSTDDSIRGPMAAAVLRHLAGGRCDVVVLHGPVAPHPLINEVLAEIGIGPVERDTAQPQHQRTKTIDYAITISEGNHCSVVTQGPKTHWRIRKPIHTMGDSIQGLRQIRDQIMEFALSFVADEIEMTERAG